MQNAQIWQSIEALNNEAEAALKIIEPIVGVIKSAPSPAFVTEKKVELSSLTVLKSEPTPKRATLATRHKNKGISIEAALPSSKLSEIAAAIDRAIKAPKTTPLNQDIGRISDDLRHDLLKEVENAVRTVVAAELPQLVRYAVSVSMHELLITSKEPKLETKKNKPLAKTNPKKIAETKVAGKLYKKKSAQKRIVRE